MGQAYRGPKRTILCIDEDSAILRYEWARLERSGSIVLATASPQQGPELTMKFQLDAIVLDYQMPGMNGHKTAAAIKSSRPDTLIVTFSASEIPDETLKLAEAVVLKMDAVERLPPTVRQLCNRPPLS